MKIVFAGTPEFAACALGALSDAGHDIVLVLTQPDRPAGRGLKLQASAVKQTALERGLMVDQPISLRLDGKYPKVAQAAHERLRELAPDAMVVAAYGLILPESILSIPKYGCVNIHGSLLPRWRGAAPIQRAIEAGDAQTGIAIMKMDVGLDTGPVYRMEALPIAPMDTAATLHDKLAALGARLCVEVLSDLPGLTLTQQLEGACYAAKIDKREAQLDWNEDAVLLERKIRAFNPMPGASMVLDGASLKIWLAEAVAGQGTPGEILARDDQGLSVACGQGALRLIEVQKPGGRRIAATQLTNTVPNR